MRRFKVGDKVIYRGKKYTIEHICSKDFKIGDYYLKEGRCYALDSEVSEDKKSYHEEACFLAGIN